MVNENETRMTLEFLSNESSIDLFEHFNVVDLLRSFTNLNRRLNSLLFDNFHLIESEFHGVLGQILTLPQ